MLSGQNARNPSPAGARYGTPTGPGVGPTGGVLMGTPAPMLRARQNDTPATARARFTTGDTQHVRSTLVSTQRVRNHRQILRQQRAHIQEVAILHNPADDR